MSLASRVATGAIERTRAILAFFHAAPEEYEVVFTANASAAVIVCHGNVIRWITCRVLGADPKLWLNMGTTNCGVTTIQVRPDGKLRLISYSDFGHLPPALQTTAWQRHASGDPTAKRP